MDSESGNKIYEEQVVKEDLNAGVQVVRYTIYEDFEKVTAKNRQEMLDKIDPQDEDWFSDFEEDSKLNITYKDSSVKPPDLLNAKPREDFIRKDFGAGSVDKSQEANELRKPRLNFNQTHVEIDQRFKKYTNDPKESDYFKLVIDLERLQKDHIISYSPCDSEMAASNLVMNHLSFQDKTLLNGVIKTYKEVEANKMEDMDKLAELCDPFSLAHEGYFYNESKKALNLANLFAIEKSIIKPSTMGDSTVFISLGDDGGCCQAILRAYQEVGGAKGIIMREQAVDPFDLDKMKTRLPTIEDMMDVVFDIDDLEDDALEKLHNDLPSLSLDAVNSLKSNTEEEAENGAALVYASKEIPFKTLWNQEVEFKAYFLYYSIVALSCLERNGNFVCRIYDINSLFTKSLIYLLSCNFTSMLIIHPHSINNYSCERYAVFQGMLHKDGQADQILDDLKKVFVKLQQMHVAQKSDFDTLLIEKVLRKNKMEMRENEKFQRYYMETLRLHIAKRTDFLANMSKANVYLKLLHEYKDQLKTEEEKNAVDYESEFNFRLNKGMNKCKSLEAWGIEILNKNDTTFDQSAERTHRHDGHSYKSRNSVQQQSRGGAPTVNKDSTVSSFLSFRKNAAAQYSKPPGNTEHTKHRRDHRKDHRRDDRRTDRRDRRRDDKRGHKRRQDNHRDHTSSKPSENQSKTSEPVFSEQIIRKNELTQGEKERIKLIEAKDINKVRYDQPNEKPGKGQKKRTKKGSDKYEESFNENSMPKERKKTKRELNLEIEQIKEDFKARNNPGYKPRDVFAEEKARLEKERQNKQKEQSEKTTKQKPAKKDKLGEKRPIKRRRIEDSDEDQPNPITKDPPVPTEAPDTSLSKEEKELQSMKSGPSESSEPKFTNMPKSQMASLLAKYIQASHQIPNNRVYKSKK